MDQYFEHRRDGVETLCCGSKIFDRTCSNHSLRRSYSEPFYLRSILQRRAAARFVDARTVNGNIYDTLQDAVFNLGHLDRENESYLALEEANQTLRTLAQLRFLFTELISDSTPALPIWNSFQANMAVDFAQTMNQELAINEVLLNVASVLGKRGQSLSNFGPPEPQEHTREVVRQHQK